MAQQLVADANTKLFCQPFKVHYPDGDQSDRFGIAESDAEYTLADFEKCAVIENGCDRVEDRIFLVLNTEFFHGHDEYCYGNAEQCDRGG